MAKILIVDDDPSVLALLRVSMRQAGHEVHVAGDGLSGLALALGEQPDLVVTDLRMPRLDGFGMLAALRANAPTAQLPVVVVTALDEPEHLRRAVLLGADSYLMKPVQIESLCEAIDTRLARAGENRNRALLGEHADAMLREPRHATVLYSDIRRFSRIAEILSAPDVVALLHEYYSGVSEIIRRQRGTVVKIIGDAVLSMFESPPGMVADDAERGLRTALLVQQNAREFAELLARRHARRGLPRFAVGVGVHKGDVMVCSIGSESSPELTAIGDTVNIAARLEASTKSLGWEIVASAITASEAGSNFDLGARETLAVRGRNAPVEVTEVRGFAIRTRKAAHLPIPPSPRRAGGEGAFASMA